MTQEVKSNTKKDKRPTRLTGEDNVLGNRLKELREAKGLSFGKLAKILEKSKTTVIGYEHGYRFPLLRDIDDLAEALDTSVAYLIGETDIPGPPITKATIRQTIDELIKHGDFHFDGEAISDEELERMIEHMRKVNEAADKEDNNKEKA